MHTLDPSPSRYLCFLIRSTPNYLLYAFVQPFSSLVFVHEAVNDWFSPNSRSSCFVLGLRTIWVGCSVCNCSDVPKILLSKFSLLHLFGVFGQDNYSNVLRSYLKLIAWYGILVLLKTASPIQYPDYSPRVSWTKLGLWLAHACKCQIQWRSKLVILSSCLHQVRVSQLASTSNSLFLKTSTAIYLSIRIVFVLFIDCSWTMLLNWSFKRPSMVIDMSITQS